MYRLAATLGLEGGNVRSAFRCFYHGPLLERDLTDYVEAYITLGIPLAQGLRKNLDSDYGEWGAATSASLAAGIQKNEATVVAFQLAGMCASDLGWIRGTGEHYEGAVKFINVNDKVDSAVAVGVRVSYGLS